MTWEELARFWIKVKEGGGPDPLDPCWEWQASLLGNGYGQFKLGRKPHYAHRIAWEIANGAPAPKDKQICHRCDNPICVKPYHLFIGSAADNVADAIAKGRRKQNEKRHGSGGQRGEKNKLSKLTVEKVIRIRTMASQGYPQRAIAKTFMINRSLVSMVVSRKRWSHVP